MTNLVSGRTTAEMRTDNSFEIPVYGVYASLPEFFTLFHSKLSLAFLFFVSIVCFLKIWNMCVCVCSCISRVYHTLGVINQYWSHHIERALRGGQMKQ